MSSSELAQFYEAHIEKLYRYFFYKVLNREVAEDLTSNCFLKFAKEQQVKQIENPKAYLFGVAKFVLLDYLRAKYKGTEFPLDEENDTYEVDTEIPDVSIIEHLEKILPVLPSKQSEVLRLRFIEKLNIKEIGKKLGKDQNYVSTTQKRAFQSIKRLLECTDTTTNIVEE